MATIFSWAGAGLSTSAFDFTTSIGTDDTAFSGVYGTSSKLQVVADGSRPARFAVDDSVTSAGGAYWKMATDVSSYAVRFYFECSGYPVSASGAVASGLRGDGGAVSWRLDIAPSGQIRFRGDGAAAVWSPTSVMSLNTVYRVEIVASGATATVYISQGDSPTALYTSPTLAIGATFGTLRLGENDTNNLTGKKYDDIVVTNTATRIGPAVVMTTVSAGDDQAAIEPFSMVSLAATTLTGSVATWAWSQLSGPSVALSGSGVTRTFTASATIHTSTLVFKVVGDGGPSAQVSVQVLPQLDWLKAAGGLVALRSQSS